MVKEIITILTGWLVDFMRLKENYHLVAIDVRQQQGIVADLKANLQISLIFFIIEEAKETIQDLFKSNVN